MNGTEISEKVHLVGRRLSLLSRKINAVFRLHEGRLEGKGYQISERKLWGKGLGGYDYIGTLSLSYMLLSSGVTTQHHDVPNKER